MAQEPRTAVGGHRLTWLKQSAISFRTGRCNCSRLGHGENLGEQIGIAAIDSRRLLQQGYIDWHLAQALCRCNATKLLLKYWSFELDRGAH